MKVLVTGGAGYIGSHTAKALARSGCTPIVIDDLSTGHAHNVKWGPLVRANLCDKQVVRSVLKEYKIEAVVHFAGSALVGESVARPLAYFQNNVAGTLSLLEAMLDAGVSDIVFSSTCATYGVPAAIPITEDQPQNPINPYGESKLTIERALAWLGIARQVNWTALRYFNAAGADPEGEIGEEHDNETHLIPLAIGAALGSRDRLQIFGADYDTPDGTAIRDYIHVTDLASAHVGALQYLRGGGGSRALNLGTGTGASVREVVAQVRRVTNQEVPTATAPRRPGDPPILVASPELARRVLGWEPAHSTLETIIRTAWQWHARSQSPAETRPSFSRVSA